MDLINFLFGNSEGVSLALPPLAYFVVVGGKAIAARITAAAVVRGGATVVRTVVSRRNRFIANRAAQFTFGVGASTNPNSTKRLVENGVNLADQAYSRFGTYIDPALSSATNSLFGDGSHGGASRATARGRQRNKSPRKGGRSTSGINVRKDGSGRPNRRTG